MSDNTELLAVCSLNVAVEDLRSRLAIADAEMVRMRAALGRVRQEPAATPECDCGTCLACRVADVVGA